MSQPWETWTVAEALEKLCKAHEEVCPAKADCATLKAARAALVRASQPGEAREERSPHSYSDYPGNPAYAVEFPVGAREEGTTPDALVLAELADALAASGNIGGKHTLFQRVEALRRVAAALSARGYGEPNFAEVARDKRWLLTLPDSLERAHCMTTLDILTGIVRAARPPQQEPSPWIDVDKRLPTATAGWVIAAFNWQAQKGVAEAKYMPKRCEWINGEGDRIRAIVTHWMPLPQHPKEAGVPPLKEETTQSDRTWIKSRLREEAAKRVNWPEWVKQTRGLNPDGSVASPSDTSAGENADV